MELLDLKLIKTETKDSGLTVEVGSGVCTMEA